MFGDDTAQATTTTDDTTVNPALPPANMGDPLAAAVPVADDTSSFPAAPAVDDTTTAADSTTSDAPAIPETDPTLGQDTTVAAPAAVADDASAEDTSEELPAPSLPETPSFDDVSASDSSEEPVSDSATPDTSVPADASELVDIKQQALEQLSPLVDQLDQSPEERFRTTMMMIQASDNQSLVKQAFESAQAITDDKARAQALLDVINEINYFTTQAKS